MGDQDFHAIISPHILHLWGVRSTPSRLAAPLTSTSPVELRGAPMRDRREFATASRRAGQARAANRQSCAAHRVKKHGAVLTQSREAAESSRVMKGRQRFIIHEFPFFFASGRLCVSL
jgi:hypothetical protein